jgi:hypothetical protein
MTAAWPAGHGPAARGIDLTLELAELQRPGSESAGLVRRRPARRPATAAAARPAAADLLIVANSVDDFLQSADRELLTDGVDAGC